MFKVSCIQFCAGKSISDNLKISKSLILKAIRQNSNLIITPETSSLFGLNKKEIMMKVTSMQNDFYLKEIKKIAKQYEKWILIGSIITKEKKKN